MLRLLIFLVGMLSTRRPGAVSWRPARDHDDPDEDGTWYLPPRPDLPLQPTRESRTMPFRPERVRRRPRVPRKLKWAALLILAALIFRIRYGVPGDELPNSPVLQPAAPRRNSLTR